MEDLLNTSVSLCSIDIDATEGIAKEYSDAVNLFQGIERLNEAKLIGKELHIYGYSSIGEPRIVDMINLKHLITKSVVDEYEDNGEGKVYKEYNYGNEYEEEDIGGEEEDGDDVVISQNNFFLRQTTEYDEHSTFHDYQVVSANFTFSTTTANQRNKYHSNNNNY